MKLEKYKLQKKFMMAPIPPELLLAVTSMFCLKALETFLKYMPNELKDPSEASL